MGVPKFMLRLWKDIKRKEFIPLKILYFMVYGGMFTLFPFLSIQARSLGIREAEIGSIYGALPILGVLASSVSGMVADKIGNFKIFLSITMATSGISSLVFLSIPEGRITHKMPQLLPIEINCTMDGAVNARIKHPYQCEYFPSSIVEANVVSCRLQCQPEREAILSLTDQLDEKLCSMTSQCSAHSIQSNDYETYTNVSEPTGTERVSDNSLIINFKVHKETDINRLSIVNNFCPDVRKIAINSTAYSLEKDYVVTKETCWFTCDAQTDRNRTCKNDLTVEDINPVFTIVVYVLVRILHAISVVISIPLFEGATISILQEHDGDIGLQRMYSNVGQVVMTPLSGILIDAFSHEDSTNFKPAFYLYCAINLMSAICISFIDLKFKKPAKKLTKELKNLLASFEVITFIIIGFIAGITLGVIDTFFFWILENMGASKSLMGLTITVGSSVGIPMMIFATPIINKIGHINALIIGLFFFVIRLLGYSLINNPWWAMPFEAMECFTAALFSVAHVSYAASLSTSTTIVSLQSLSTGVLHGVGRGIGSMIGGFLTKAIGLRIMFRVFAAICGITAVVYFILNLLFFRKKEIKRKMIKDKEKEARTIKNIELNNTFNTDTPKIQNKENENKEDCVFNDNSKINKFENKNIDKLENGKIKIND